MQKPFPSVLSKRVYAASLRVNSESPQKKPAKPKKSSREKFSKQRSIVLFNKNLKNGKQNGAFRHLKKVYNS